MAGRAGRPLAFWDTSALVPLCVRQRFTSRAIALYKTYEVVVWWATPLEIAGALARLVRMKQLDSRDWMKSRQRAIDLADFWSVIQPSNALRAQAMQLVENHELRAADALQLAAALEWCQGPAHGEVFLTGDQRLRDAAILNGFDAQQM